MSKITEKFFNSKDELTAALAQDIELRLIEGIKNDNRAVICVSGGSSPKPAYQYLSTLPLAWDKVDVVMVDERWVEPSHEKSNETFIKQTLLQNQAKKANFLPMKNDYDTALEGLAECEQSFQSLKQPFDITILGMGPDGHTASLFPHAQGLDNALFTSDLVCAIEAIKSEVTGDITQRLSLSLHGIKQSKVVKLLISGEEKLAVYKQAKLGGKVEDMPLRAILNQTDVEVQVYWAP
ncbi:6-phosphogluconolactonase [Pseudoalteromonas sp. NBT06-2]|uniref:6-phosphogluconolactonase n=1 Tax=Pseudoalteromonas sp. NBT06-2 TaxID=2025950 RepID=UPI000BA52B2B|nr:6-phosphogluconolactonase [Pseudoalteromonas sp. NBT06-2]PAJ75652.1 6-phosphogluconolactonase [Pseudoalteromonas sp. NBT06-2]